MDQVIHAGKFGVSSRCGDGIRIDIIALQISLDVRRLQIQRFVAAVLPDRRGNKMLPGFGCKCAVYSWSDIGRDHSCLNGEGSASAERIHKDPAGPPRRESKEPCGEVLGDRSRDLVLAVAALMQRLPGSIKGDRHLVFHEKNADGIGVPGLGKLFHPVFALHALHHRLFHDGLDI